MNLVHYIEQHCDHGLVRVDKFRCFLASRNDRSLVTLLSIANISGQSEDIYYETRAKCKYNSQAALVAWVGEHTCGRVTA